MKRLAQLIGTVLGVEVDRGHIGGQVLSVDLRDRVRLLRLSGRGRRQQQGQRGAVQHPLCHQLQYGGADSLSQLGTLDGNPAAADIHRRLVEGLVE